MSKCCVYCGSTGPLTDDHVPPRVVFTEPRRSNLITVPACSACNHRFCRQDEQFASFLSVFVGIKTEKTKQLHQKNMKIVAHNKRLRRVIRSRIRPVWVRNEKMIIGTAQGLHWSPDEHDLMIARFIKALYDDCFKRPLPLHVPVEASRQQPFTAKVLDMWRSWPGENIEGFIVSQLKAHIALDDAVHGERRRANERAQKAGKVIALGFLSPIGPEPFRRLRERSGRALAAFSAGMKREKRPKLRLKSEKRPRRSQS